MGIIKKYIILGYFFQYREPFSQSQCIKIIGLEKCFKSRNVIFVLAYRISVSSEHLVFTGSSYTAPYFII